MKLGEMFPSKYIAKDDLKGRKVKLVIDRVVMEDVGQGENKEIKPVLYFSGKEKGLVLNVTNGNTITSIVGTDETDDWPGTEVELYFDPTVQFKGKTTGGLRIVVPFQQPEDDGDLPDF